MHINFNKNNINQIRRIKIIFIFSNKCLFKAQMRVIKYTMFTFDFYHFVCVLFLRLCCSNGYELKCLFLIKVKNKYGII